MFYGEYSHTLDKKNRLIIPSRFRDVIKDMCIEKFYVTRGLDECLFIFPEGGIKSTNPPFQAPYKDGAFITAIKTGVPIVPVSLPFNWQLLPDDGKLLLRGNQIKIIVHEPIETANLKEEDIPEMKNKVFDIIENELISYHPDISQQMNELKT